MYFVHTELKTAEGRCGKATIAWKSIDDSHVQASIAWCSPKDMFWKRKGRLIAGGRLEQNTPSTLTLEVKTFYITKSGEHIIDADGVLDAVQSYLGYSEGDMTHHDYVPQWARRAIRRGAHLLFRRPQ